MGRKRAEVHLTDDEIRRAKEAEALTRYYASGRGDYSGSVNTTVERGFVEALPPYSLDLPRVRCSVRDAEVEYAGKVYAGVPLVAAEALKAIIDSFPLPARLTTAIGPHPERAIKKLPEAIRAHIFSNECGYIFSL